MKRMSADQREIRAGMLTLNVADEGGTRTIALVGELDLANAPTLETELEAALGGDCGAVVVDMAELTFIDSTGIALLVASLTQNGDEGRLSFVPSRSEGVLRVLQLTGIDQRLPLVAG